MTTPTLMERPRAFTLIELLTVMAIMVLLLGLLVPAINSTVNGMRISSSVQQVVDEVQFARATALALNLPVDVCFLQTVEAGKPSDVFRALQSRLLAADGSKTWISRIQRLPEGTSISSKIDRSTLFGQGSGPYAIENAPSSVSKGIAMRIYPSGDVETVDQDGNTVGSTAALLLTLGREADIDNSNLPPNFATVEINTRTGRVKSYQP